MHALVVSPIPSDPADQGNAARIGRFCEMLQYRGYQIHFVYYGMEGLTAEQKLRMEKRWGSFYYVQPKINKRQTAVDGFDIDDYCGQELGEYLDQIRLIRHFDLAIINYVWASRAINHIHPSVPCVLDTHDLFGGRHEQLQSEKVAPTWFYCSPEMEAKGLDRADYVVAIQSEEAKVLALRTEARVLTIGHILPRNFLPSRPSIGMPFRVGYLGSDNPSNRRSLDDLFDAVRDRLEVLDKVEFLIGGRVANRIPHEEPGFKRLGYLANRLDFYRQVDLVINPNISGTGLKIKTVEALSHGMPFITTRAGMCGVDSDCDAHNAKDAAGIVDHICQIDSLAALEHLAQQSRSIFDQYTRLQVMAFDQLIAMASGDENRRRRRA